MSIPNKFIEDRASGKFRAHRPKWDSASIKVQNAHSDCWKNARCSGDEGSRFFIFILEAFKAEADKYVRDR